MFGLKRYLKELELYKREAKIIVDEEIAGYRRLAKEAKLQTELVIQEYSKERKREIELLAIACAEDTAKYEHTFHHSKEEKGIELARLDSLIVARKETAENDAQTFKLVLDSKDAEIKRLDLIIKNLTSVIPSAGKVEITNK